MMTAQCPHNEKVYLFGRGSRDAEHQQHQADIAILLDHHHQIERYVRLLPNGFTATTTSTNPDIVQTLQTHVVDMKARFAKGRAIRSWDAVYALLFACRDEITVNYDMRPDGVTSHVTTNNPMLVELLQAHAHTVSGFVQAGRQQSGDPYPLSETLEKYLHQHHIQSE